MTKRAPGYRFISAVLLAGSLAHAGEQAQFQGSTTVELPKPKRSLDTSRRINNSGSPERPDMDGGFLAPPAPESNPLSTKKRRDELDRKKNWIFMNPYQDRFDSKADEFMKGEKGTGLYDNRWMSSDEEKSAVQKFLDEKKGRERDETRKEKEDGPSDRLNDQESSLRGRDEDDLKKDDPTPITGAKAQFESPLFKSGLTDPFASGKFDERSNKDPFAQPFSSQKAVLSNVEREEIRQNQIVHEREFNDILQGRPGGASTPLGQLNGLNPATDIGRLDLNSSAPVPRREAYGFGSRGGPSPASFTDGSGALSPKIDFGGKSFNDGFAGGPSKITSPFAASAPQPVSVQGPAVTAAPFVLPYPQRKF